jgi:ABC-type transporter MlaC component
MRRHRFHHGLSRFAWLVGLAVIATLMAAAPARAQSCPGDQVVHAAVASLNQAASTGTPQAFAAMIDRHADVSQLAMFALGPYRRALPEARRGEYVELTRQFLGRLIAQRAGGLANARMQIVTCSSDSGYDYIDARLAGQRVVWRLEGGRIVDVNLEGIWLLPQMRANFVSVIQRGNGDPAVLIDHLRSGRGFG